MEQVSQVLDGLGEYWPLTLRQVYYQLVAAGHIANNRNEYQKLSRLLVKARLGGLVPWDALEDRARDTLQSGGWRDKSQFVADQLGDFLRGYRRDLLQSQEAALEVWVEKDALSRVCHRAAFGFCVPVIVARGFSSVSYVNECRDRVRANAQGAQRTVVLYFGDLDPSGWAMLPAMMETLQHEMGLHDLVEGVRCALTAEQVAKYDLPQNPDALKRTDSRAKKYTERFGNLAVELDALPPATLEGIVRASIEEQLDLDLFREEQGLQHREQLEVLALREQVRS
ncbi:MAG: hypothetical protein COZ57_32610, partial [Armatimonadetes bacterium CG_4_8_14_3_um_filter_66_20]